MKLETNEGTVDRAIRAGLAGALVLAGLRASKKRNKVLFLGLAAFVGATAASGYCPAYAFAGFDTLGYRTPVLKMGACGGGDCKECSCSK